MNVEDYGWYLDFYTYGRDYCEPLKSETLKFSLDNYHREILAYYNGKVVFSICKTTKSILYCPKAKFFRIPFDEINVDCLNKILKENNFPGKLLDES